MTENAASPNSSAPRNTPYDPLEACLRAPDKGSGDHAADVKRVYMSANDTAKIIQALQSKALLVRRDLEHGIDGRIKDRLAGVDVLFPKHLQRFNSV